MTLSICIFSTVFFALLTTLLFFGGRTLTRNGWTGWAKLCKILFRTNLCFTLIMVWGTWTTFFA